MGLKNNNNRWNDELSQIPWDKFEALIANYYAQQGYRVVHVGTGANGSKYDGGIDIKLYKDDKYTIVQCKHWNAKQVPHNDVHQLIGLLATEKADAGIFVTSGEYTAAALQAATKSGKIELIDGFVLRQRLNLDSKQQVLDDTPWREEVERESASASNSVKAWSHDKHSKSGNSKNNWSRKRKHKSKSLLEIVVTVVLPLIFLFIAIKMIPSFISNATKNLQPIQTQIKPTTTPSINQPVVNSKLRAEPTSHAVDSDNGMTHDEIKEWERKNKESMEILEKTTPEL